MRRALLLVPALLVATAAAFVHQARASCGAEDCPLGAHGHQFLGGRFGLDLSLQYIDQDKVRVGTHEAEVGALPSPEDEVRTLSRIYTVTGSALVTPRLGLTMALPWIDREHQHIAHEEEEPELQDFRYEGVGDLTTTAQWIALGADPAGGPSLSLLFGVKLPTGRREVEAIDGEQPEPPARPGTGSVDGIVGFHAMKPLRARSFGGESGVVPLFVGAQFRRNGQGTEDYRVGNELQASAGASYPVFAGGELLTQLNLRVRGKDDVGETDALADNTGGTWLYLSPGFRLRTGGMLGLFGYVQIPVYQKVNRIQLVSPYHLLIGTSIALSR